MRVMCFSSKVYILSDNTLDFFSLGKQGETGVTNVANGGFVKLLLTHLSKGFNREFLSRHGSQFFTRRLSNASGILIFLF